MFSRIPPQFKQSEKFTEFPVQMALSSVIKPQPNILKIESLVGLVVYCKLDEFSCNVTVSGYYHNKTLGKIFRRSLVLLFSLIGTSGKVEMMGASII